MSDLAPLAGRGRRLVATLIDAALVPAFTLVLVMITGVVEDAQDYATSWWALWVFLLAVTAYLILNGALLWQRGQTIGKWVLGIAIVSAQSNAQDLWRTAPAAFWKLICLRALFFPLLFIAAVPWLALVPFLDQIWIFGKQRRCLHDLVAGTVVVRLPRH